MSLATGQDRTKNALIFVYQQSVDFFVLIKKIPSSRIHSEEEFRKTIEKIPDYRIKEEKVSQFNPIKIVS